MSFQTVSRFTNTRSWETKTFFCVSAWTETYDCDFLLSSCLPVAPAEEMRLTEHLGQTHCQVCNTHELLPYHHRPLLHRRATCMLGQFTDIHFSGTWIRKGVRTPITAINPFLHISALLLGQLPQALRAPEPRPGSLRSPQGREQSWRLLRHPVSCDTHSTRNSKGVQELKSASGIDFLFIGVSRVTLQCRDKCVICASPS